METIEVMIGGRRFRLQCGPGQAARVSELARTVDRYAAQLIQGQRGLGEEKLLLLTNLMLADQLLEARDEIERLTGEVGRIGDTVRERATWAVQTAARRLDALARKIEQADGAAG